MNAPLVVIAIVAAVFAVATVAAWLSHLRRTRVVVVVDGDSMAPTFGDGDHLLFRRCRAGSVTTGDVVAIAPQHADQDGEILDPGLAPEGRLWLVKRVAAGPGELVPDGVDALADRVGELVPERLLVILGDNPAASQDSRQEGFISIERMRGIYLRNITTLPRTRRNRPISSNRENHAQAD